MTFLHKHYGHLFVIIGLAHILTALINFRSEWAALFRDGFFNQVDDYQVTAERVGYWFILLGPALIVIGMLAQAHLDATGTLPPSFCWTLAIVSFLAGLAMFENGIWFVGLVSLVGLRFRPVAVRKVEGTRFSPR